MQVLPSAIDDGTPIAARAAWPVTPAESPSLLDRPIVDWMGELGGVGRQAVSQLLQVHRDVELSVGDFLDLVISDSPSAYYDDSRMGFTAIFALSDLALPIGRAARRDLPEDARTIRRIADALRRSTFDCVRALQDPSPGVRMAAVLSLGRLAHVEPSAAVALREHELREGNAACLDRTRWEIEELARGR